MKVLNGKDLTTRLQTVLIYGAPGTGKTSALGALPGKTLIIDTDRGADVLMGHGNVDIVRLSPDLKEIPEILNELNAKCDYDNVCVDSLSELEGTMLTILGRTGRNGGAPELSHYGQVNFKIVDLCRQLRALSANIFFTCWEELREVVSVDGSKYSQIRPMLRGKTADTITGLCDIVGNLIISRKNENSGQRFLRLEATPQLVAKDRFFKRQFCLPENILNPVKEETIND